MRIKFFIWIWLMLNIVACTRSDKHIEAIIDDTSEMVIKGKNTMSSFIEVKNVISLETSDECLLGEIEKIIKREGNIFVKSKSRPLTMFDKNGKYLNTIGRIGSGPEEYTLIADFDVDGDTIYILTVDQIQVYSKKGDWIRSIPLSLNASGLRITANNMLLFVLGDKHIVHVFDKDGNEKKSVLERNQALRLNRAISFVQYGEKLLFPMGRSNELLVYIPSDDEFGRMNYLASNRLTSEKEEMLMKENPQYKREMLCSGCFDGLMTSPTHVIFPYVKEDNPMLWIKDMRNSQCRAYILSSLENDVTFGSTANFFYGNVEDDCGFMTYILPYLLKEHMAGVHNSQSPYFEKMKTIAEQTDKEANPILIEYVVREE
ncbi:MAG TPA: 6-bladed beta-propeller [Candidatus Phocaeicola gallistercoris]|nr:6-bladed beta-propeller [Candidatus Phocaeicola gallistercoris]